MKKFLLLTIAVLLLIGAASVALADESAEEGIQIVDIVMVPQPTPTPPPDPPVETRNYEHDAEDIELLARFLWISPLRDREAKKTLCWVVFNRVDMQGLFGDCLEDVIVQSEFGWYDPKEKIEFKKLEENRKIAWEAMNEWVSEDHGFYVGRHVPKCGVYQEFAGENNRQIEVYKEKEPKERTTPLTW